MIRVTVELLPGGSEGQKRLLGTATIANDLTADHPVLGSYDVKLLTGEPSIARLWSHGRVENFQRDRSFWELLYLALYSALRKDEA